MHGNTQNTPAFIPTRPSHPLRGWLVSAVGLLSLVGAIAFSLPAQQSPSQNPEKPYLLPEANRPPDSNDQAKMSEQKEKKANADPANAERKRQIADDSARLLELAKGLKAEVNKTNKDMLSLSVIRKAELIEKLAHSMKEKTKQESGAS
jgi:hypothetical protein